MSTKTGLWLIVRLMKDRTEHENKQVLEGAKEIKGTTLPQVSPNLQEPTGTTEQKQTSKSKQSNLKLRYG